MEVEIERLKVGGFHTVGMEIGAMSNSGSTNNPTRTGYVRPRRGIGSAQAHHAIPIGFLTDYNGQIDTLKLGDVTDHFFPSVSDRLRAFDR